MRNRKAKPNYRRIVLRLPDLDHSKMAVLNSLTSPGSRRSYAEQQSESMQATGAGDTIRRGDYDHGHPADSKRLFEDARPALVTEGEGDCASGIRPRPASGVGNNHPRSEADSSADQRARRAVGT